MNLTHLDENQNPTMVDVGEKSITKRVAKAQGKVWLPSIVREQFTGEEIISKKGPVFATAIIAGTMAVKKTSDLIPFCHQLNIDSIKFSIEMEGEFAQVSCTVSNSGKTGVEMEAIVGVNIACSTIYDMCKALSQKMIIQDVMLVSKTGGKSDIIPS
jgi:cyclic pyranopterin monophosphate synthase